MPMDAVVIHALKKELATELKGARIDKVQMPEKDMLVLIVRGNRGNRKLLLSAHSGNARIHFTNHSYENPPEPPMFCMLMRKHLVGARITDIRQPEFDRLIIMNLSIRDEMGIVSEKQLIIEMLGRASNIILVDGTGNIIDCIRRADFGEQAYRRLLPGMIYRLPAKQSKIPFFESSSEERTAAWTGAAFNSDPEKRMMTLYSGLSPLICRELVYRCYGQLESFPEAMDALVETVDSEEYVPVIILRDGVPFDFTYMYISQYGDSADVFSKDSFSELLDEFYYEKDHYEIMRRKSKSLLQSVRSARDRTQRKLNTRIQEMKHTEDRDRIRREADLITANMYQLKKGMRSFSCQDFYDENNPDVVILLDPLKTPQQNAALKYKKYNKLKHAREHLEKLIRENTIQLDYLNSVMDELERAESVQDLAEIRKELLETGYLNERRNTRKEKVHTQGPLRFRSDEGFEILVGRNNAMNDELSFHRARRTDLWFHTQKIHGSHVIIRCDDRTPSEQTIEQAASIAVYYSQARDSGKTPVDFTMIRNLKKPTGSMPGYVIYREYETIFVEPDEKLIMRLMNT